MKLLKLALCLSLVAPLYAGDDPISTRGGITHGIQKKGTSTGDKYYNVTRTAATAAALVVLAGTTIIVMTGNSNQG